ncbi:OmpH family outer membrane protein [Fulvivirgaceae bacterium PWU5]|uniref:OmpH family outer membrane protein n=1 Tax=Dawidia cretensis TaxID=2782350 RepID=A0AAP2DZ84_9BACT|nr:OmpH family outer membrane protein [Dawidia cretensis]MBT1708772.1 OmpH family outer membrane protein [Dawidia cretensis]
MKLNTLLLVLNLVVVTALAGYLFWQFRTDKKAFILNQRVFVSYEGTKALEAKLSTLRRSYTHTLDSMQQMLATSPNTDLVGAYEDKRQQYALAEQEMSDKYTADIWRKINQHVSEFGKENGYDFIFGATGDGNLMFAGDAYDVTDDIIDYINQKYEGD